MKILNFGSLNYDYVYSVNHIVNPGETISSSKMETFCGGKGLNQSIALARAGTKVYHAGIVGKDGETLINICQENGVDTSNICESEGKSGHTIIQVDENGQNCILLFGGSNISMTKKFIDNVLSSFEDGDIVILQNEINLLDYIIEESYKKGIKIILNPSPFNSALKLCDLSKVSIFILNEIEGEQLTGEKETSKILNEMLLKYPNAQIILTLGSAGAIYKDRKQEYFQNIYKVDVVDTTGAGDTFTGYFISSLINKIPINESLEIAARASAISVSREGATASIPFLKEVKEAKLYYK